MALIKTKAEAQVYFEMTFSKTCQVDIFTMPALLIHLVEEKTWEWTDPRLPPEFFECACKAKHSVVIGGTKLCSGRMKYRLCDFHFDYLYEKYVNEADKTILSCKFRRNRL